VPDCAGDWTMFLKTKKADKDAKYYVGISRHFSPQFRSFTNVEAMLLRPEHPTFLLKEVELPDTFVSMTDKAHLMPTLTVKAKKKSWTDNARAGWENEERGKYHANLYYNCSEAADEIADRGEPMPTFYDWLSKRNSFFNGTNNISPSLGTALSQSNIGALTDGNTKKAKTGHMETKSMHGGDEALMLGDLLDGMPESYKNRYILWVINNVQVNENSNYADVPPYTLGLDDVKSVYISEDPESADRFFPLFSSKRHFFHGSPKHIVDPVTVMVYTYHTGYRNVKGLRRTHFQGFDEPAVYEMPDYSVLPPAQDYRRTLYWNPNVTTDKGGRAKVEFYNNSSCRQIVASAEGITPDGKALVGE
jgi:hypothetical protein